MQGMDDIRSIIKKHNLPFETTGEIIKAYRDFQVYFYNKRPSDVMLPEEFNVPDDFVSFMYGYMAALKEKI